MATDEADLRLSLSRITDECATPISKDTPFTSSICGTGRRNINVEFCASVLGKGDLSRMNGEVCSALKRGHLRPVLSPQIRNNSDVFCLIENFPSGATVRFQERNLKGTWILRSLPETPLGIRVLAEYELRPEWIDDAERLTLGVRGVVRVLEVPSFTNQAIYEIALCETITPGGHRFYTGKIELLACKAGETISKCIDGLCRLAGDLGWPGGSPLSEPERAIAVDRAFVSRPLVEVPRIDDLRWDRRVVRPDIPIDARGRPHIEVEFQAVFPTREATRATEARLDGLSSRGYFISPPREKRNRDTYLLLRALFFEGLRMRERNGAREVKRSLAPSWSAPISIAFSGESSSSGFPGCEDRFELLTYRRSYDVHDAGKFYDIVFDETTTPGGRKFFTVEIEYTSGCNSGEATVGEAAAGVHQLARALGLPDNPAVPKLIRGLRADGHPFADLWFPS
jgi:hypothetical protein